MATTQTAVQTFTLSFDANDKRATKVIEMLKVMDFLTIEKSPYDPAFVAKINRSKKSKSHFVDVAKMWD